MSEKINVESAFNPEARRAQQELDLAQQEFNAYIASRPFRIDESHLISSEHDKIIPIETVGNKPGYFDAKRDQHEQDTIPAAYEDMTTKQLTQAWAESEHDADRTKAEDVQDALIDKMAKFAVDASLSVESQDKLWDRVMGAKDKKLEKLSSSVAEDTPIEKPLSPTSAMQDLREMIADDEKKQETKAKNTSRIDEIISKKITIAERYAHRDTSVNYDSSLDEADDARILELLMESYGTKDKTDPRIVRDAIELDGFEDRHVRAIQDQSTNPWLDSGQPKGSASGRDVIPEGKFDGERGSQLKKGGRWSKFLESFKTFDALGPVGDFGSDAKVEEPKIKPWKVPAKGVQTPTRTGKKISNHPKKGLRAKMRGTIAGKKGRKAKP